MFLFVCNLSRALKYHVGRPESVYANFEIGINPKSSKSCVGFFFLLRLDFRIWENENLAFQLPQKMAYKTLLTHFGKPLKWKFYKFWCKIIFGNPWFLIHTWTSRAKIRAASLLWGVEDMQSSKTLSFQKIGQMWSLS